MKVPQIYAQDSIAEVLDETHNGNKQSESFWISVNGEEVRFSADDGDKYLGTENAEEAYSAALDGPSALNVYRNADMIAHILLGKKKASSKQVPSITCGDCTGEKTIIGTVNGELKYSPTNSSDSVIDLPKHFVYTSVAKFFPSGEVALSAGMDYTMKSWDLNPQSSSENRSEIKQLSYQRGLVDDVVMIGRGRNLSSSCRTDAERAIAIWETGAANVVTDYKVEDAKCIALWKSEDRNIHNPDMYEADSTVGLVGAKHKTWLIDFRENEPVPLSDEGSKLIATSGNNSYRVWGSSLVHSDLRKASTPINVITTESPTLPPAQLVATSDSVVFRNSSGTYRFRPSASVSLDVMSCEQHGILSSWNNKVYNSGTDLREFVL